MRRAYQRSFIPSLLLFVIAALISSTPAYATSIQPGDTGIVPSALPDPGNPPLILDSGQQFVTFGPAGSQVTIAYEAYVAVDPFSPHLYACGGNCLDFALDAELVSGPLGAVTTLDSISIGGFGGAGASIDVDYLIDNSSAIVPSTANRSSNPTSGLITYNYAGGIPVSFDTKTLVLRTDLTSWNGFLGLGFNTTVTYPTGVPFHPSTVVSVATPEPSSILLLGSGALLVLMRRKRL